MIEPCIPAYTDLCADMVRETNVQYTKEIKGTYSVVLIDYKKEIVHRYLDCEKNRFLIFSAIKDWFFNQRIVENLTEEERTSKSHPHFYQGIGVYKKKSIHFMSKQVMVPFENVHFEDKEKHVQFMEKFLLKFLHVLDILHNDLCIIHNDIKHNNILIDWKNKDELDFEIVLIDYGLSFVTTKNVKYPSYVRASKYIAPPEIAFSKFSNVIETTIDIYAFGVLCFNEFTNFHMYEKPSHTMSYYDFFQQFYGYKFKELISKVPFQHFVNLALNVDPKQRLSVCLKNVKEPSDDPTGIIPRRRVLYKNPGVKEIPWWKYITPQVADIWKKYIPMYTHEFDLFVHPLVPWLTLHLYTQFAERNISYPLLLPSCFVIAMTIYNNDLNIVDIPRHAYDLDTICEIMPQCMSWISTLEYYNPIRELVESLTHDEIQNMNRNSPVMFYEDEHFITMCLLHQAHPNREQVATFIFNMYAHSSFSIHSSFICNEWRELYVSREFQMNLLHLFSSLPFF